MNLIINPNYTRPPRYDIPPLDYEIDEIMFRIAEGETLRHICKAANLPSYAHVLRWVTSGEYPQITRRFTAALACAGHVAAERIQEVLQRLLTSPEQKLLVENKIKVTMQQISDGLISADEGAEIVNAAITFLNENLLDVNRAKILINALQWTAERQCPQFYTPQRNISIDVGEVNSPAKTIFVNFIDG